MNAPLQNAWLEAGSDTALADANAANFVSLEAAQAEQKAKTLKIERETHKLE